MIDFRQQLKKRMKQLEINSGYALAKELNYQITTAAIDNYLSGRSEMTAANLQLILNALGARLHFPKAK